MQRIARARVQTTAGSFAEGPHCKPLVIPAYGKASPRKEGLGSVDRCLPRLAALMAHPECPSHCGQNARQQEQAPRCIDRNRLGTLWCAGRRKRHGRHLGWVQAGRLNIVWPIGIGSRCIRCHADRNRAGLHAAGQITPDVNGGSTCCCSDHATGAGRASSRRCGHHQASGQMVGKRPTCFCTQLRRIGNRKCEHTGTTHRLGHGAEGFVQCWADVQQLNVVECMVIATTAAIRIRHADTDGRSVDQHPATLVCAQNSPLAACRCGSITEGRHVQQAALASINLAACGDRGPGIEQIELQLGCTGPVAVGCSYIDTDGDESARRGQRNGIGRLKLHPPCAGVIGGIGRNCKIGGGRGLALERTQSLCKLLRHIPCLLVSTTGSLAIVACHRLVGRRQKSITTGQPSRICRIGLPRGAHIARQNLSTGGGWKILKIFGKYHRRILWHPWHCIGCAGCQQSGAPYCAQAQTVRKARWNARKGRVGSIIRAFVISSHMHLSINSTKNKKAPETPSASQNEDSNCFGAIASLRCHSRPCTPHTDSEDAVFWHSAKIWF